MICPNCGVQLPDTAKMCYRCKTVFQPKNNADNQVESMKNGIKKIFNHMLFDGIDREYTENMLGIPNNSKQPQEAAQNINTVINANHTHSIVNPFYMRCTMWSTIGSVIAVCGIFAPFFKVYGYPYFFQRGLQWDLYDKEQMIVFIPLLFLVVYGSLFINTEGDGWAGIFVGAIGIASLFVYKKVMMSGSGGPSNYYDLCKHSAYVENASGFYMILIGYIINIIVGIVVISYFQFSEDAKDNNS